MTRQVVEPTSARYLNGQAPFLAACSAKRVFGADEVAARGRAATWYRQAG